MDNFEIEAKFWLPDLHLLREQAIAQHAELHSPRQLEHNLRFDTTDQSLRRRGEVLRLRQAGRVTLTYKQPGESFESRREWEVEVDDFHKARALLEALGFRVIHTYEKYREVYHLNDCQLMLDEVPYGFFAEVEGPDIDTIRRTCDQLNLNWDARIQRTYLEMFETMSRSMDPEPTEATFVQFTELAAGANGLLDLPNGYLALQGED